MSDAEALPARIEALRRDGAARLDPARWRIVEALLRRLPGQSEAVRQVLLGKLETALEQAAACIASARPSLAEAAGRLSSAPARVAREARRLEAAGDAAGLRRLALQAAADAAPTPLAALDAHLRAVRPAAGEGEDELASVQRFRRAWHSTRTEEQVQLAIARKPANPGPLNSHALVLESLGLMDGLSPDYLRHFIVHVEALQWLERVGEALARPPVKAPVAPKPAKGGRAKRK